MSYNQVELTVTVHISSRDPHRELTARTVSDRRLECTIAVAQQHSDGTIAKAICTGIRHNEVELAVVVNIRDSHEDSRVPARVVGNGGQEKR